MKMRSLVLLALVVSACNGSNGALPVSPSAPAGFAESPLLLIDPSSPAVPMTMGMGADDFESPQDLSFDAQQDDAAARLDVNELDFNELDTHTTAAGNEPARPVIVSAGAKGTTITYSWKNGTGGGAPTTYYVVYKGHTQKVGLDTSFSFTASPGRYLVGVFAKNAAGDSPLATKEVNVGGATGNYDGNFGGSGTISRTLGNVTCKWNLTYKGTVELLLNYTPSGDLIGIMKVAGTSSEPKGVANRPNFTCYAGSRSYTDIKPVIISGANIARTGLLMGISTGTFNGNLSGSSVKGTLKAVYKYGTGTLVMPVTLKK
jgi:hypothetical protein